MENLQHTLHGNLTNHNQRKQKNNKKITKNNKKIIKK